MYRGDQKKVTYYLYDGNTLTAEIDADTDTETYKQAVFLDNAPVAYLVGRDTYAIHSDHLGTPQMVTDKDGEVVWSAEYDPFGMATVNTASLELPYRLPGQYFDTETGTHYNYLRDYDPGTGRYITSDPIGLQGGLNTYAYASNNPLSSIDPLGLAADTDDIAADGADSPARPSVGDTSEQAYTDKLKKVLDYSIQALRDKVDAGEAEAAAIRLLENMATEAAIMAVVIAAVAVTPGAAPIVLAGAWLLAGYSAAKFLYDTVNMLIDLKDIDLCDEAALQGMGGQLADSIGDLGEELLASALLGGIGRISGAVRDAAEYAGDGAWRLWRRLRERFGRDVTNGGTCSFAGDTLVLTEAGKIPIRDIKAGMDRVWAKDEHSGHSSWRDVLAHYSNRYEETVHVTARDKAGREHTISSNRIHPYFTRLAAGAVLAVAGATSTPALSSEGHDYDGNIAGGNWVDAQHLQPGDELLGAAGNWQTIVGVTVETKALLAFNLTVDEYSTYFVAGDRLSEAVWVHNDCWDRRTGPDGPQPEGFRAVTGPEGTTDYGQQIYRGDDDRLIYEGHDGRFYEINAHPPTSIEVYRLSSFRDDLGLPPAGSAGDRSTVAVMEINGQQVFGINAHGQDVSGVNAISRTHAEIDVLNQLQQQNIDVTGQSLTMHVDRQPCRACDQNGGIRSMVRQLGLRELTVIGPDGPIVITP